MIFDIRFIKKKKKKSNQKQLQLKQLKSFSSYLIYNCNDTSSTPYLTGNQKRGVRRNYRKMLTCPTPIALHAKPLLSFQLSKYFWRKFSVFSLTVRRIFMEYWEMGKNKEG